MYNQSKVHRGHSHKHESGESSTGFGHCVACIPNVMLLGNIANCSAYMFECHSVRHVSSKVHIITSPFGSPSKYSQSPQSLQAFDALQSQQKLAEKPDSPDWSHKYLNQFSTHTNPCKRVNHLYLAFCQSSVIC